MHGCEDHRRALGRLRDGEASAEEAAEARAHAASCPDCGAAADRMEAVGARLRERAGPPVPSGEDAAPVPGLREAVLARAGRLGALPEVQPFLRRTAAAAAAVFVVATAAALWEGLRDGAPAPDRPPLDRDDILAALVPLRPEPGR